MSKSDTQVNKTLLMPHYLEICRPALSISQEIIRNVDFQASLYTRKCILAISQGILMHIKILDILFQWILEGWLLSIHSILSQNVHNFGLDNCIKDNSIPSCTNHTNNYTSCKMFLDFFWECLHKNSVLQGHFFKGWIHGLIRYHDSRSWRDRGQIIQGIINRDAYLKISPKIKIS